MDTGENVTSESLDEKSAPMKLVVVSGVSGAGKSISMNALEDLGHYCVDNLPLALLESLAIELEAMTPPHERVAVAIDARNSTVDFSRFSEIMAGIEQEGIHTEVLFLEASDDVLTRRFSETRRKHPLSGEDKSLREAIMAERELLAPVRVRADMCFDTTTMHIHQLRDLIRQRVYGRAESNLSLLIQSFGFKHGLPTDANFVFDTRCLPNPHWEPGLREMSGLEEPVRDYLQAQPVVIDMLEDLKGFIERWIPVFEAENRSYLTVSIGCTGGHHRSVFLADMIGAYFSEKREGVIVRHRDLRE